jgi:hypothetical protein
MWHKGKPPSIGWWPASVQRDQKCIRWWNGKHWSAPAYQHYDAFFAAIEAEIPDRRIQEIEWSYPWWEKKNG